MADSKKSSLVFAVMILIGGLIGIISLFLIWVEGNGLSITGWEVAYNNSSLLPLVGYNNSYLLWVPMIVLMLSLSGAINGAALISHRRARGGIASAAFGAIILGAVIIFSQFSRPLTQTYSFNMADLIGTGVYMAAVAGVLMLVFGVLRAVSKPSNKTDKK